MCVHLTADYDETLAVVIIMCVDHRTNESCAYIVLCCFFCLQMSYNHDHLLLENLVVLLYCQQPGREHVDLS